MMFDLKAAGMSSAGLTVNSVCIHQSVKGLLSVVCTVYWRGRDLPQVMMYLPIVMPESVINLAMMIGADEIWYDELTIPADAVLAIRRVASVSRTQDTRPIHVYALKPKRKE